MEMNRIEELLATTKLNDMMHKKDDDQKTTVLWILAIIGAVFGNGYVKNKVMEFVGPGVSNLSADFRIRIIWKTLKKILTMISTMISSVMKMKYSNIKKAAKAGIVKDSCLFYVRVYR